LTHLTLKKEYFFTGIILLYIIYDSVAALVTSWNFTTDDAYISWIYARHLVEGKGLVWNSQLPIVEGYSNTLWVLISALILSLKLPLLTCIKSISCACLTAALFFLYRLSRLFFSPLLAILPVFIFSHYVGVVWWTVSGLETLLYCALAILAFWQGAVALGAQKAGVTESKAWVITNIALLLLSLTRFEGPILCIPLAVYFFCRLRALQIKPPYRLLASISLIFFLIPYVIYLIWRLHYFGHWIPNTYRCKGLLSAHYWIIDRDYFFTIIPLLILSLPYFLEKKECKHVLLWLPSILYGLMLWKADPVVATFQRLFLAPFAFFCILPVLGTQELLRLVYPNKNTKIIISGIILVTCFLFLQGSNTELLMNQVSAYQERTHNRLTVAKILNEQASDNDAVLITDCGLIPYAVHQNLRFIDTQCLNNAAMAEYLGSNHLNEYIKYLINEVKPRWVIANEYPLSQQGDYLVDQLKKQHFFDDYELISTLKSRATNSPNQDDIELIYRMYKRY
jgi:hypothetical protein